MAVAVGAAGGGGAGHVFFENGKDGGPANTYQTLSMEPGRLGYGGPDPAAIHPAAMRAGASLRLCDGGVKKSKPWTLSPSQFSQDIPSHH